MARTCFLSLVVEVFVEDFWHFNYIDDACSEEVVVFVSLALAQVLPSKPPAPEAENEDDEGRRNENKRDQDSIASITIAIII